MDIEESCQRILRKNIEQGNLYEGLIDGRNIQRIRDHGIWRIGQRHRQIHLFAGIGGFPLGFRWAGLPADFSVLTGGPPCQPFSTAGRRQGTADARYLWPQMLRFIRLLRPEYAVFENVAGFTSWGDGEVFDQVCADLEGEKYEVITPLMVPACAFGADHRRDRVWIVAHCDRYGREQSTKMLPKRKAESANGCKDDPDTRQPGLENSQFGILRGTGRRDERRATAELYPAQTDSDSTGRTRQREAPRSSRHAAFMEQGAAADATGQRRNSPQFCQREPTDEAFTFPDGREAWTQFGFRCGDALPDWAGGTIGMPHPLTEWTTADAAQRVARRGQEHRAGTAGRIYRRP